MMKTEAGLYVHIPFCEKKCDYCDFYSVTLIDEIGNFVRALQKEIKIRAPHFSEYTFQTIYFGGGTPSLLNEKQISKIWDSLVADFNFDDNLEISIEGNPGTLSHPKLAFLKELGFNRLSLGVQGFNTQELKFLGRIHSVDDIFESYYNARDVGFANINIDLMTAFPGITLTSFYDTLKQTMQLKPEHISCYTLIFEPGTVFHKKMKQGVLKPLEEDEEAFYYQMASEILQANDYVHYEISNFSFGEDYFCRHNQIYWQHRPYLGLGPSAHSFLHNRRLSNKRSLLTYVTELEKGNLAIDLQETLSNEDMMFEYIFLNLRLRHGINFKDFRDRFGVECTKKFGSEIQYLSDNNFIEMDDSHLRLSEKGWLFADSIATYF